MDNRIWESGAAASPPAAPASPSTGYPSPGNPLTGTPATKGGAFWFHQIGESLRSIMTAAGVTPDHTDNTLLLESIQRLIDAQSGNYALDTGAADAYVVALDPVITAYPDGLTVRVKAVNANTGASTLNAGGGAVALVNDVGGALVGGDVPAASIFTATYISSANKFHLTSMVASQQFGVGQTWQSLLGSRSAATTYYNTTKKPIVIAVSTTNSANGTLSGLSMTVSGVVVGYQIAPASIAGGTQACNLSAVVPPGGSYLVTLQANTNLLSWVEFR